MSFRRWAGGTLWVPDLHTAVLLSIPRCLPAPILAHPTHHAVLAEVAARIASE
jgi:hypothetical protein